MSVTSPDAGSAAPTLRTFAFLFPVASGHLNPSLPVARRLVRLGHRVHYLSREQMREAIEDTGATWHSEVEHQPEAYSGRREDLAGFMEDVQREHGLGGESMDTAMNKLKEILVELQLPGVVRWLQQIGAHVIVCCPAVKPAWIASKHLGIPVVGLMTWGGPGVLPTMAREMLKSKGLTVPGLLEQRRSYQPLRDCFARLERDYGWTQSLEDGLVPLGGTDAWSHAHAMLVTTTEALQEPTSPEVAQCFRRVDFAYVGPLLDEEGARRAAGHKLDGQQEEQQPARASADDALARQRQARAAGRQVVLVSMGTVVTGDFPNWGWAGRPLGADGEPQGLTGRELCHAAWGGAFDAFGAPCPEEGPLLLVALGPQHDALGPLAAPPNAICLPVLPQVDVLRAGVDLFLTHGGQNSFMEALSEGVPLVVCPTFADQPANARKAVSLGVGLQVVRPVPARGEEPAAAAAYRTEVAGALREVAAGPAFRAAAARIAEGLRNAGGVPRAVELVLGAAATGGVGAGA